MVLLKIAGPGSGLFLTPGGQAPFGFQIKQGIRESPEQDWALAGGALLGPAAAPGEGGASGPPGTPVGISCKWRDLGQRILNPLIAPKFCDKHLPLKKDLF